MSSIFEHLDVAGTFAEHLGEREVIVYTRLGGAPITLEAGRAIFFEEPVTIVHDDGSASTDNAQKELHLQAADIPAPAEGDTVLVRGITYKVVPPIRPDGKGMIAVSLVKVV